MLHFLNVQQRAFFGQQRNHNIVRFKDVHTVQCRISTRQISAVRTYRVSNFQTVFLADDIVIRTMAWRGMYRARTGIQRHVIAEDRRNVEAHKRMGKAQQFKLRPFYGGENGIACRANALHHAFN